jgi:hypothetical protein
LKACHQLRRSGCAGFGVVAGALRQDCGTGGLSAGSGAALQPASNVHVMTASTRHPALERRAKEIA